MEWNGDIGYGMRPVELGWGHCVWNGNKMGATGIQTERIRNGMGTLGMGLLRMERRCQV